MRIQIKHKGGEIRSGDRERHHELTLVKDFVLIEGEVESAVRTVLIQLPFEVRRDMKWNGKILKIELEGKKAEIAGNDELIYIRGEWLDWYIEAVREHNRKIRQARKKFTKIYLDDPKAMFDLFKKALFKYFDVKE